MDKENAESLKECITDFGELSSGETNQAVRGAKAEKESLFALIDSLVVEWQPIEAAPRYGSIFLIVDSDGKMYTTTCSDNIFWTACNGKVTPTHWMPLPTPPTK